MFQLKNIVLLLAFFMVGNTLYALSHKEFKQREDSLAVAIKRVANASDTATKLTLNRIFHKQFEEVLRLDSAFFYAFDNIPYLYKVASADGLVRVISWNVPLKEFDEQRYFGFVLTRKKNEAETKLTILKDKRRNTKAIEAKVLQANEWFGALYTQLVEQQMPYSNTPVYTLLGISLNTSTSGKKVIDILNVNVDGGCTFGAPVFIKKNKTTHRIIFEYNPKSVMYLRYNEAMKMIVFSSLVPMYKQLQGRPETYVPGDGYEGFKFDNGQWIFRNAVNPPSIIEAKKRVKVEKTKR